MNLSGKAGLLWRDSAEQTIRTVDKITLELANVCIFSEKQGEEYD